MKNLLAALMFLAVAVPLAAQGAFWSGAGTPTSATISSYIVSAKYGTPHMLYANATCDSNATNALVFWKAGSPVYVTVATNNTQPTVWVTTTNLATNGVVVLQHASIDTYDRLTVASVTASNVTFTANPSVATVTGDVLYSMTVAARVPIVGSSSNKEWSGSGGVGVWSGQYGRPLLIEVMGTTSATLNAVSGSFDPNP